MSKTEVEGSGIGVPVIESVAKWGFDRVESHGRE